MAGEALKAFVRGVIENDVNLILTFGAYRDWLADFLRNSLNIAREGILRTEEK